MIKQFVPQEVCLKCQGCCRFKEAHSVWLPCLLDEEIQELLDKEIPAAYVSIDKKLMPIAHPKGEGYLCPFLGPEDNLCKIYTLRPLECQLYPFLVTIRAKKILLTVDPNCPYVQEKLNSAEFKSYLEYLTGFLNAPAQIRRLKDNPQILAAYEDVLGLMELKSEDEIK